MSAHATAIHADPGLTGARHRIEAEYRELPGLRLTLPQVSRLWGLAPGESAEVLAELMRTGFLMKDADGMFRRRGCARCVS